MNPLLIAVLVLVVFGLILLWAGARRQRSMGLPAGTVIYSDPVILGSPEKPFFDPDWKLTGKPDYLVKENGIIIPVEVKSGAAPESPRSGHIYQLLAYCRLLEAHYGNRPPYGIVRYANRSFRIDYTPAAERELQELLEEITLCQAMESVARSHNDAVRCRSCGFYCLCGERLPSRQN